SGSMSPYVFASLDSQREIYHGLKGDEFQQPVPADDQIVDDSIYNADDKGVKFALNPYREELKLHIKAILAEQLVDENIKQQILSQNDPMLEAVLHLIENQIAPEQIADHAKDDDR